MNAKHSLLIHEGLLFDHLNRIFPNEIIQTNIKKDHSIKFPSSGSYMEFDIYLPTFNLCFEFQDSYHYVNTWYNHNSQSFIQQQDKTKNSIVRENGITIIYVPCWWNGTIEELKSTISFFRPDIIPQSSSTSSPIVSFPISSNPPASFFQDSSNNMLMLASFPHNHHFNFSTTTTTSTDSWWMGEKYDGIRCYWNADSKTGYTRYMNEFSLIPHITNYLPNFNFDSEFWFGRGSYSAVYGLINDSLYILWFFLRAIIFDKPLATSSTVEYEERYKERYGERYGERYEERYEERYNFLLSNIDSENNLSIVVPRVHCVSSLHLSSSLHLIIQGGGEGLILQHALSPYIIGRSNHLVKLKATQGDAEAIVVQVNDDKSIVLQQPNGTTFTVPVGSIHTPSIPKSGTIVTYTYSSQSRRSLAPVHPVVYRVRRDVVWEDEVRMRREKVEVQGGFSANPQNHWTPTTMRSFMERFARKRNMDPLLPETWYSSSHEFRKTKGGRAILTKIKGGYFQVLCMLFPDVKFDSNEFLRSFWGNISNRRRLFEKYAKSNKFNPHDPQNWYMQSKERLLSFKGVIGMLRYHSHNVSQALMDIFPNIGLNLSQLKTCLGKEDKIYRREFFENYARQNRFDPLIPANWYHQSQDDISSTKGGKRILLKYKGNIFAALVDVFPNIGLDVTNLPINKSWRDPNKRREFFVNYAKRMGFNPLDPQNWYSQTKAKVLAQGGSGVLVYHKESLARALLDLFPDIGLQQSLLRQSKSWKDPENRRQFFKDYASEHGFDYSLPDNWYMHPKHQIIAAKGAGGVLEYHNRSVAQALVDLFPSIQFDVEKLSAYSNPMQYATKRKQLFVEYARDNGFDPYIADNWYSQSRDDMMAFKGMSTAISYHSNRIQTALAELFPNIGIDESMFSVIKPKWGNKDSRRKFFENYASQHSFDPLLPSNWSLHCYGITHAKGVGQVLFYHKGSIIQALKELFPSVSYHQPTDFIEIKPVISSEKRRVRM